MGGFKVIPIPPRCPDYYRAGCPACQARARVLRYRRTGPTPTTDAAVIREHIVWLRDQGMSYQRIADRAGVDRATVYYIYNGRIQSSRIGDAILGVQPWLGPRTPVLSIGTARRLQALACAGYGIRPLARMMDESYPVVQRWRNGVCRTIWFRNHQQVERLYDRLHAAMEDGPTLQAARRAAGLGFHPFDAWTDETIDDPLAPAYGHLDEYVDWEKIQRVRERKRVDGILYRFVDLTWAEQQQLFQEFVRAGGSPRTFRDRYRPVPAETLRALQGAM